MRRGHSNSLGYSLTASLTALAQVLVLATSLAGCDLFDDLERHSQKKSKALEPCSDYCAAVVYAWDDCLGLWYACGITNEEESTLACTDMCVDAAEQFEDEELDAAIDCIECYLYAYGETPSCWDVYLTDLTPCVDDCEGVDTGNLDEDWVEAVEDDCVEGV